uniref:Occludin b n=1 Tax=Tetraodon nigroviridis TaxID=99883 RepID=H3CG19_TETNG
VPAPEPSCPLSHSSRHRHSELMSNPAFAYYPGDQMLHFYRWTSPPGVMKILSIIIIIMCVAIFACVASTLVWDYDMSLMGGGTSLLHYGYGGMQMDPKTGKGFIIAIAAITFIAVLIIFVLVISRQSTARSPSFYLATIIICAILAFLMIIATIVYLVAVNPTAQTSGSIVYDQVRQLCAQYQSQSQAQGIFLNQYLYHYCVVEPQEAIAIVLGFLVFVGLIILLVFAAKTRSKIRRWGPERILWEEVKVISDGPRHSVGEWVKTVSGEPDVLLNEPNLAAAGSRDYLDRLDHSRPLYLPGLGQAEQTLLCCRSHACVCRDSDISSSVTAVKPRPRDYDTGAESGDDLDEEDFGIGFPSIVDEEERLNYKREFDQDHQEYKSLQAELDGINQELAELDTQMNTHPEGSPQFLDAMERYHHLKSIKKSSNYQIKKKRCKYLRAKLSHIKRRISEYDRRP